MTPQASAPTTTYTVLARTAEAGPTSPEQWAIVGKFKVGQGRADVARNKALAQLEDDERTRGQDHTVVAVPGWRPETYEAEPPAAPKFKKKAATS